MTKVITLTLLRFEVALPTSRVTVPLKFSPGGIPAKKHEPFLRNMKLGHYLERKNILFNNVPYEFMLSAAVYCELSTHS
jgi:hypothetical protein